MSPVRNLKRIHVLNVHGVVVSVPGIVDFSLLWLQNVLNARYSMLHDLLKETNEHGKPFLWIDHIFLNWGEKESKWTRTISTNGWLCAICHAKCYNTFAGLASAEYAIYNVCKYVGCWTSLPWISSFEQTTTFRKYHSPTSANVNQHQQSNTILKDFECVQCSQCMR